MEIQTDTNDGYLILPSSFFARGNLPPLFGKRPDRLALREAP
jgi:hypothetical protein